MITLHQQFDFDAAHHLPALPEHHKCHRMHGHTYRVELALTGDVDPTLGWLIDYAVVRALWQEHVHNLVDHRVLNDVPGLATPTTEVVAMWIHGRCAPAFAQLNVTLAAVTVWESSTTHCTYRP